MSIYRSFYQPPAYFKNYHVSTIYAALFRKVENVNQERERIELKDGDFIDIDWSFSNKDFQKTAVILHGLEGNAQRPYIQGMANYLNLNGWDVAAVNLRGCSGEPNRLYRSYNAGASEDLAEILNHIITTKHPLNICLSGFSLGGNLILKYLGENNNIPNELKAAVTISVPCDLHQSLLKINQFQNKLYARRFLKSLKNQLYLRQENFPAKLSREEIEECLSLKDIDQLYTSKAHGYLDAIDYYKNASSLGYLKDIQIPSLLISAKNDGFLSPSCYPVEIAKNHDFFHLEIPKYGGHVGFLQNKKQTYTEERTLAFFESSLENLKSLEK